MTKGTASTVRRRRLAATLRSLREAAEITPEQVMDEMGWSRSKVSKVETANMGVSVADVRVLCELYAAEDGVRDWLVRTARDARRTHWWDAYDEALPERFRDYLELESEATAIHHFEIDLVPGLLQTKDYASALMTAYARELGPAATEAQVELRMQRQTKFREAGMHLSAIVDESALLRCIGSASTRRAQLRQLLDHLDDPHTDLRVLPMSAGAHAASGSPFGHLFFQEPIPSVVFLDNLAGSLYIERAEEVAQFGKAFRTLRQMASDAEESAKLLRAALTAVG
ncbi:helix-turn-helix transcriptional regulator [Saccharopolyspora cebuensis]|uniref:Helix-turn-helix domain-containing protein n=1 Tax=Saccharopolyspora cebuensis TaxID=418759 RepID=A0ABV4CK91_9PSEU